MKKGVVVSKRFMTSYLYVSMSTSAKLLYMAMALVSDEKGNINKNRLALPNKFSKAQKANYQELLDRELIRKTKTGYQVDVVICGM